MSGRWNGSRQASAHDPDALLQRRRATSREVYRQVRAVMETLRATASLRLRAPLHRQRVERSDGRDPARASAAEDQRVKVIVNTRNFGHIRSPFHGLLQARATRSSASSPTCRTRRRLIREFVASGRRATRSSSASRRRAWRSGSMFFVRGFYYRLVGRLSATSQLIHNFTGFGLYDRVVIEQAARDRRPVPVLPRPDLRPRLRSRRDPLHAAARASAASPRTTSTRSTTWRCWASPTTPRCRCGSATMAGFAALACSPCWSPLVYLVLKLAFWNTFDLGLAPLVIGIYFFGAVQLFFIGIAGRVHRLDPHAGAQAAAGRREGAHQLRALAPDRRTRTARPASLRHRRHARCRRWPSSLLNSRAWDASLSLAPPAC